MHVELLRAKDLNDDEWRTLQAVSRSALNHILQRSPEEIDHLIRWDRPEEYVATRRDPKTLVGNTMNPNQTYSNPRVAVAMDADDMVGFAYVANNVSGASRIERTLKQLGAKKNYLWFRDIAVEPSHQREGMAKWLAMNLLMSAKTFQPVTAYVWPDEMRFMPRALRSVGFAPTGEQEVHVFGEDAAPVRQVRMQAPSVAELVMQLGK